MRAFYFGCWRGAGHHYYEPGGRSATHAWDVVPWGKRIDGGIIPKPYGEPQVEGVAHLAHLDGWTALAFWDRTIDSRGNSHSTFVFDATLDYDAALEQARALFPEVFARLRFDVVPA